MTPLHAVFDTSVLLRAAIADSEEAQRWMLRAEDGSVVALAPDLLWAELANVLAFNVRTRLLSADRAAVVLDRLLGFPVETYPLRQAAARALAAAARHGLSAYDAFYLTLAAAADAVLLTADRKVAAAAERSELIV